MNRTSKRKSNKKTIIAIILMLLLCVAAVFYIKTLTDSRSESSQADAEIQEQTEEEAAEAAAEQEREAAAEAEAAEAAEAGSHVYAHRGAQGDDEFSFDAYDRAVAAGAGYIEADMVVSADGTPYVAHDDYAVDMTGYDGYFSGMIDSQIDGLKTRAGNSVLKLSDLFDKYGDSVKYIVDIKYAGSRNTDAFADVVKEYGYEDKVVAASFYQDALSPLEDEFPDMPKIYLCTDQGAFNQALGFSYADILCVPADLLTEDNLKAARDNDKLFSGWTLNTEDEIRSAIELGVDSYFTDESELAVSLEKECR